MVRNLSFKADDDFDDKLYSVSKKRGMTKSAFIKSELMKIMEIEGGNNFLDKKNVVDINNQRIESKDDVFRSNINREQDSRLFEDITNKFIEEKRKKEMTSNSGQQGKEQNNIVKHDIDIPNITTTKPAEIKKEEVKIEEPKILITKPIEIKEISKQEINRQEINRQEINRQEIKPTEVKKKMSGELDTSKVDERYRKLREQEIDRETFTKMAKKVNEIDDRICKDGECTKKELSILRTDINELKELKGLKERFDKIEGVSKIVTDIDKKLTKTKFKCEECGEETLEVGNSFCSECGMEIHAWEEDPNWKPYKERKK